MKAMYIPGPNPKTQQTLEEQLHLVKSEASSAKKYAVIALIISGLSIIPDYYNLLCSKSETKIYKSLDSIRIVNIEQSKMINAITKGIENKIDSIIALNKSINISTEVSKNKLIQLTKRK